MAQTRKDLRGRVLRKGESQRRSDERYVYTDIYAEATEEKKQETFEHLTATMDIF